jgi:hypothetical protein
MSWAPLKHDLSEGLHELGKQAKGSDVMEQASAFVSARLTAAL